MRAAHFCQQCGKVQPPVPVDYFTFFGLPYRLNLDTKQLEREFYDLSRHLHPDINAGSSDPEQEWSLEKSSQLNDAYRTLKDPITRTEYLLRLQGVELEEQSKAATEEARRTGEAEEASCSTGSAGRGLRVEHAAGRAADEQEDGRGRPHARVTTCRRPSSIFRPSTTT